MKIYYCDKWSVNKKKPWNILDEPTAYLHHCQQPYTAILTENEKPEYIVNVTKEWVSVDFYDELTRMYLNYDFKVISEGKIFLRTAIYWEYEDETDKELNTMIIGFREDGYIAMEKRNFSTGIVEERENMTNLEKNWDVFPGFGQYLYLCREER